MKKILFIDESGDHNLKDIDSQHPIFVLGGVIVDESYAYAEMTDKLNRFKTDLFGTSNIILHTADFTRQKNGFERMKEPEFCRDFYKKLNHLLSELNITIVACAIKKNFHIEKYGLEAIDPYHLSLNVLTERFCFDISDNKLKGNIIAEARDFTLDRQLESAWSNIKVSGTGFMRAVDINKSIDSLFLKRKDSKLAGLEIADLIVTPIARTLLGRKSRVDIDIIKSKMRKNKFGEINGYGLVVLPKK